MVTKADFYFNLIFGNVSLKVLEKKSRICFKFEMTFYDLLKSYLVYEKKHCVSGPNCFILYRKKKTRNPKSDKKS